MSLLSYTKLVELIEQPNAGLMFKPIITDVTRENVNSSSIDISLGAKILTEGPPCDIGIRHKKVFIKNRDQLELHEHDLNIAPYYLYPGEFVLAHSKQVFNLPLNISAEYKLKSSLARSGLEHLNAGWCDAGWNGSCLTLELKNMTRKHTLVLEKDMPIGQMVLFEHETVPINKSYAARGRYNNDETVCGIKE